MLDKTAKLAKVDAVHASSVRATLYSLVGDLEQAKYWIRNARLNGANEVADSAEAHCYTNLGFTTLAAALFPRTVDVSLGATNRFLHRGIVAASFSDMIAAAEKLQSAGGTLTAWNVMLIDLSKAAAAALKQLDVGEDTVRRMMDRAGEILRAERLLWLDAVPDLLVSSGNDAFFSLRYRVDVAPERAADLNWSLAERLAEANLMPRGVTVGFVGAAA